MGGVAFGILNPGRMYDPSALASKGNLYIVDFCNMEPPSGFVIRGGLCGNIRDWQQSWGGRIYWDSSQSPLKGDKR